MGKKQSVLEEFNKFYEAFVSNRAGNTTENTNNENRAENIQDEAAAENINKSEDISNTLKKLNPVLLSAFKELVFSNTSGISDEDFINFLSSKLICNEKHCPECNSSEYDRFGKTKQKKQRYKCKKCGKTFSDTTGSPISYSKKPIKKWVQYIECICQELTIRQCSAEIKISIVTAFQWRHKILNALKSKLPEKLGGVVEIHEEPFVESFKGNHSKNPHFKMNRPPRHRGVSPSEYASAVKVFVLCALDRKDRSVSKVEGKCRGLHKNIAAIISTKIEEGSTMLASRPIPFVNLAKRQKLRLEIVKSSIVHDDFLNLDKAKHFAKALHDFIKGFRGVATKYLNNYIAWLRWKFISAVYNTDYILRDLSLMLFSSEDKLKVSDFRNVTSILQLAESN